MRHTAALAAAQLGRRQRAAAYNRYGRRIRGRITHRRRLHRFHPGSRFSFQPYLRNVGRGNRYGQVAPPQRRPDGYRHRVGLHLYRRHQRGSPVRWARNDVPRAPIDPQRDHGGSAAREDVQGSEEALEGPAGFYNAFTGNNRGELSYVFTGPNQVSFDPITEGLGTRWELLHTVLKMYPTAGYNCPIIDLMTDIRRSHVLPH